MPEGKGQFFTGKTAGINVFVHAENRYTCSKTMGEWNTFPHCVFNYGTKNPTRSPACETVAETVQIAPLYCVNPRSSKTSSRATK